MGNYTMGVVGLDVPVADLFHAVNFNSDSTESRYAFVTDTEGCARALKILFSVTLIVFLLKACRELIFVLYFCRRVLSHPLLPRASDTIDSKNIEILHPSIFVLEQSTDLQPHLLNMLRCVLSLEIVL